MTRDPSRIPIVLDAIRKAWEQQPDLRLCQIIVNAAGQDPYYVEDDKLIKLMDEYPPCSHELKVMVPACAKCGAKL